MSHSNADSLLAKHEDLVQRMSRLDNNPYGRTSEAHAVEEQLCLVEAEMHRLGIKPVLCNELPF